MKKYVQVLLVVVLAATLLIAACSQKSGSDDEVRVGLAMNTLNNPFFVTVKEGAEAQAEEMGVKLVITDSQGDPSKQISDVENLLQQKLDLIIINPVDSDAVVEAVRRANDAKVPVITVDRQANGGDVVSHIGFDALKSGGIAASFLDEALGGQGKVVEIQGILGTNVGRDRSQGFNDYIEEKTNIEIVARQSANFDRGEALKVMEDILQAQPDIDGVYAANDEMVMGALSAIEAAGRLDEIVIIGTDAIDPAMDAIRNGKLNATIAEPPFFLGKEGVITAMKIINGESVDSQITLENNLVTADNVDTIKTR